MVVLPTRAATDVPVHPSFPWGGSESWHPLEPSDYDAIKAMLPYTRLLFPPGTQASYSNLGFIFLGRVIELLSGYV